MTTALLKPSGTAPSNKEQFTSFMIEGSSISRQSLTRKVGQGSRRQDFVGEFLITFAISSGEASSNLTSPGGFTGDGKEKDVKLEKDSRILAILLVKKPANCSANFFCELFDGRTLSGIWCKAERRTCHSFLGSSPFSLRAL